MRVGKAVGGAFVLFIFLAFASQFVDLSRAGCRQNLLMAEM